MQRLSEKLVNWASVLDEGTLAQAETTATMPFIFPHVALMPDAHLGKGSTVGSVIPTRGAVMPAAVGVDIGCGMQAVRTQFTREGFLDDLHYLRELIVEAIPMGIGERGENTDRTITEMQIVRYGDLADIAEEDYSRYCKTWDKQLGTLGSGNHFIEAAYDEEGFVWLSLHSGSRGVGNKAAVFHIEEAEKACKRWFVALPDRDLAFLPQGTPEFDAYIRDLRWTQKYARANRDEMMDRVLHAVAQWVGSDEGTIAVQDRFDCHHNFAEMEHHYGTDVLLTRKGAVRARIGDRALIPGSMGTASYVVTGKGDRTSFVSAPHGAGRAMGRNQARKNLRFEDQRARMDGILWGDSERLLDECPGAYKDIAVVMADAADLVEIQHTLRPIMNIKGY
jgi:tRNA-splicing ligase RtcB